MMTDPNIPYDVAKAVRTARQKLLEKLQLGVAHARSHSGRFGNTGKSIDADNTRADYVETSVDSFFAANTGQRRASDPKPWKKPWDI
jgi:hypothetical protein